MKGKDNCRQFCILLHALMLVTLMISYSPNSCADVYILENWDSGTPPSCWPCKEAPSCCSESWNGWETRDYSCDRGGSESGLSTKIYHSPPCSYYQNRPANDYFTCDIWKWLPEPYPTKIYLRFYVFFTCNWISFDNPAYSTSEFIHLIFTNTARSGAGDRKSVV